MFFRRLMWPRAIFRDFTVQGQPFTIGMRGSLTCYCYLTRAVQAVSRVSKKSFPSSFVQVCQCFVFCALLEFALVNYASRSDMQRDRARERMERARRQWELEHADQQAMPPGAGPGPTTAAATTQQGDVLLLLLLLLLFLLLLLLCCCCQLLLHFRKH